MLEKVMPIFKQALAVSGKSMLALFAFMLLFFILLLVIHRTFPGKE